MYPITDTDSDYEDSRMTVRVYDSNLGVYKISSTHRHHARMTQIVPGFVLGNAKAMADPRMLHENRINAIVSLLPRDSQSARRFESRKSEIREIIAEDRHKWLECHDLKTQDLLVHMSDICDFIDKMACPELSFLSSISIPVTGEQAPGTPTSSAPAPNPTAAVLIHCAAGKSRSPTIVIAYLMRKLRIPFTDAINFVKSKHKIKPNRGFLRQLEVWDQVQYEIWEDEEKKVPKAAYKAFLGEQEDLLKERELKKTLQPESAKL